MKKVIDKSQEVVSKKEIKKKVFSQKELQQLQNVWEKTRERLKKSKSAEDQMIAKFLECNYIHPKTGLITNKNE